jgi:hypothetical protein
MSAPARDPSYIDLLEASVLLSAELSYREIFIDLRHCSGVRCHRQR